MPEPAHKRQLTLMVYTTPVMTPTTARGLSIRLSMFELRGTGDWDIFLGPPEETGGADQWVLKRRECSGFARVHKVTSTSLGYPLSVFNKNSTLKPSSANISNLDSRDTSTHGGKNGADKSEYQRTNVDGSLETGKI